jgi:SP family sugar:H+ symporter-like MFS transporter
VSSICSTRWYTLNFVVVVNFTGKYNSDSAWRTPIAIQFAWAAILASGMFFMPETPRWLLLKGREQQARKSLGRLISLDPESEEITEELALISAALAAEAEIGKGSYMDCFRNGPDRMLLRTFTGMGIQAWQQLSGVNFIFYYGTTFFKSSGISNPFLITIATNVVNVGMTIPGILVVDKVGRRKLLVFGAMFMAFCELIVLVVGVTVGKTDDAANINLTAQRVLIAFVCLYIATFAATWGPGAYIVCAEIFPLKLRAKGISLSVAANWLWNFGIGYATPYLVDKSTPEVKTAGLGVKVFAIWTSTCFCAGREWPPLP